MPYLHWEMYLDSLKMSSVIQSLTEKAARRRRMEHPESSNLTEKLATVVEMARIKYNGDMLADPVIKRPLKNTYTSALGKYLLAVAHIYKALDTYLNIRELQDYLYPESSPPIHPRRTLDQSYYYNLVNTDGRDKDQVVYRGTRAGESLFNNPKIIMVDQLWLYVLDESKSYIAQNVSFPLISQAYNTEYKVLGGFDK